MSDPYRSDPARPHDSHDGDPVSGTVESVGVRSWSARSVGGDGPEWHAWTWTMSGRRRGSCLGVLLLVLGGSLLVQQLLPGVTIASLVLAALAVAFGTAWLIGGWNGATVPTLVLGAWSAVRISVESGHLDGDGWTSLAVGAALVAAWALGAAQKVRRAWALWSGLVLVVFGLAAVADVIPSSWDIVWPLVLVGLGVVLLVRRPRP